MTQSQLIARHFRDVYFGGNWTDVNLKDTLNGITWKQAVKKIDSLNTIAALVFHINYYVVVITCVLKGQPLTASDKYSFDVPAINNEEDWKHLLTGFWEKAEQLNELIEALPGDQLSETFADAKYGSYYRNLQGLIEHTHYHLGQIAIIKKLTGSIDKENL